DAAKDRPTGRDPAELKNFVGAHGGEGKPRWPQKQQKTSSMAREEWHQRNLTTTQLKPIRDMEESRSPSNVTNFSGWCLKDSGCQQSTAGPRSSHPFRM
ncbi:unnamed protein product, partial [Caenorhabditis brenneri]